MPQPAPQASVHTPDGRHALRRYGATALGVALALWLLSPVATACYVEAYMARIQSMAILQHAGLLRLDDQAYPINTEMLYVTRLGMVTLLNGAMQLLYSQQIWVLRVVNTAALLLLVGSGVRFARRWAGEAWWAVVAAAVLIPGIVEPGFFLADNLPAAALVALALALVRKHGVLWRSVLIGVLLALATLIRLDSVLAVPAVAAVAWLALGVRRMLLPTLAGLAGAGGVFALSYKATGVSLPTALRVARFFSAVNNNPALYQTGQPKTIVLLFFGFFGLLALPLLLWGAWHNARTHGRAWAIVMVVLPALFYAAVLPHANEIRDFCLLPAPFVLLHTATGIRLLLRSLQQRRPAAWALAGAMLLVLVAPPYLSMRDGPRALTGRLYSPLFWHLWQGRTLGMLAQLQQLITDSKPGEPVLAISSQFEPDRYLHLLLLENGFRPDRADAGVCSSVETFRHDGRTVVSIRTEDPYGLVPGQSDWLESMQISDGLACEAGRPFARRYFLSVGDAGQTYLPGLAGAEIPIPGRFPIPGTRRVHYGALGLTTLSPAQMEDLERAATLSLNAAPPRTEADRERFARVVQARFWTPRDGKKP